MTEPVKKKRGRKPKPKPENEVPKVKKKRGRKPKPKTEPEVPKVKKKRGRKKKCDIDALNKITGYSNVGESIDMIDNKINFSECDNNLDENLPSQKISFGNLSIIVQNAKKDDPKEIQKKFYTTDNNDNHSHIVQEKKQICSLNFSDSEEESDSEDEYEKSNKKIRLPKRINKDIKFIGIMKHYESINDSMGKDVPKKTDLLCWYCSHSFKTQPLFLPTKKCKDRYKVCGNFCSWGCVKAYSTRNCQGKYNNLVQTYFKELTGENFIIKSNPPFPMLKAFGGNMTITEYRNISPEKFYIIMEPNIYYTRNTVVRLESY